MAGVRGGIKNGNVTVKIDGAEVMGFVRSSWAVARTLSRVLRMFEIWGFKRCGGSVVEWFSNG